MKIKGVGMNIRHDIHTDTLTGEHDDPKVLLTNRKGGYLLLSKEPRSRYEGVFFFTGKMLKTIECLHHTKAAQKISPGMILDHPGTNNDRIFDILASP